MHSKVVSRYILMYYNRQKKVFIHSSLLSLYWSPLLMSYDTTMSNEESERKIESTGNDIVSSSFFFLFPFITIGRKRKKREKKSKISCLSKRRSLSLPPSLPSVLYRWLLPPTPPSFLFKDCRRLGAASSDDAHTFYVIVVELCWPWMTRSSKRLYLKKIFFHSTIDYLFISRLLNVITNHFNRYSTYFFLSKTFFFFCVI